MATFVAPDDLQEVMVVDGPRRDRGQAAVVLLVVTAVLFVSITSAALEFGGHVLDRTRAQTAADAAALAALDGGPRAAAALAQHHGAAMVSFQAPDSDRVTVVVRVGRATATASATDAP